MPWSSKVRKFTRAEFYALVWSKSCTAIAEELGCSDSWIKKVCQKHKIPKPGVGYWAKVQNGQKPKKSPLPSCREASLQRICFTSEPQRVVRKEPEKMEEFDQDILELLARARRLPPIKVGEALSDPHPLVLLTLKALEHAGTLTNGLPDRRSGNLRDSLNTYLSSGTRNRALLIMDALLKRVELLGGGVQVKASSTGNSQTVISFAGETAGSIRVKEKFSQEKRLLNAKETKYIACHAKKYHISYLPTGKLVLDDGGTLSSRCYDQDAVNQGRLETRLDSVVEMLIRGPGNSRIRRRREDAARLAREQERIRCEEVKRQQKLEREKIQRLFEDVDSWQKSVRIRDYLENFKAFVSAKDGEFPKTGPDAEYFAWASAKADRLDPFKPSPKSILDEKVVEVGRQWWEPPT